MERIGNSSLGMRKRLNDQVGHFPDHSRAAYLRIDFSQVYYCPPVSPARASPMPFRQDSFPAGAEHPPLVETTAHRRP